MEELKLTADCMLGGLAKWLRLLGFDTHYLRTDLCPNPDRILVTRRSDRPHQPKLAGWQKVIRLSANDTRSQLLELSRILGLTHSDLKPMTRCSVCNGRLEPAEAALIFERLPDYIQSTHQIFAHCPDCDRIYWPGTHHQRMMKVIDTLWPKNGT